jgi:transcriptional regulator with XRE-family HTH domain
MTVAYVTEFNRSHRITSMIDFGKRFRAYRESKNVSGWAIEKHLGIENFRMVVSNIETGRRKPTDDILKKLAQVPALEIDFDTLKSWVAQEQYTQEQILKAAEEIKRRQQDQKNAG